MQASSGTNYVTFRFKLPELRTCKGNVALFRCLVSILVLGAIKIRVTYPFDAGL